MQQLMQKSYARHVVATVVLVFIRRIFQWADTRERRFTRPLFLRYADGRTRDSATREERLIARLIASARAPFTFNGTIHGTVTVFPDEFPFAFNFPRNLSIVSCLLHIDRT